MGGYIRCGGDGNLGGDSLCLATQPVFSRKHGLERRASRLRRSHVFLKAVVLSSSLSGVSDGTLTFHVVIPFRTAMLLRVWFVRWKKLVQQKGLRVWEDPKQ